MAEQEGGTTEQATTDAPTSGDGTQASETTEGKPTGDQAASTEGSGDGEAQGDARATRVDDRVSWRDHRKVRQEARQWREAAEQRARELEQTRGRTGALEEQIRHSNRELEDHRSVVQALRDNPDIYEALKERLGGGGDDKEPRTPAARAKGPVTVAGLDDDTLKLVKEAAQYAKTQKAREEAAAKQRELAETKAMLKDTVTDLLKKAGYQERMFPTLVPHVMRDIIALAHEVPGEGSMEDVPFLFNEWLAVQAALDQERTATRIADKTKDAKIPPSLPGGGVTQAAPKASPLDSDETRRRAREVLEKSGWGGKAA